MNQIKRICCIYFSPTGSTRKICMELSRHLAEKLNTHTDTGFSVKEYDITFPENRNTALTFNTCDLVIIGYPVYAGRIPNLMLKFLAEIQGNNTPCIAVVTYGNRAFDDALAELKDTLEENGFSCIAAGAFVGQHSFSSTLAAGRPDYKDLQELEAFGDKIHEKVKQYSSYMETGTPLPPHYILKVPGHIKEERVYYQPVSPSGEKINILKVKPVTSSACTRCGECISHCPMGSISKDDPSVICGPCIKCNACVRICPVHAKSFADPGYITHKTDLENKYGNIRGVNYIYI